MMTKTSSHGRFLPFQTYSFLIVFALMFHLLAAVNVKSSDQTDANERMVALARAGNLGHSPREVASEFSNRETPALQIIVASFVIRGAEEIGITNTYAQGAILRILSGLLGILLSIMLFLAYRRECGGELGRVWLMSLLLFLWFLTPIHVSYSGEAWSGMLFFLGLAWFLRRDRLEDASNILAGIPMGLALFYRFESWAMIAGLLGWLWFSEREHARVLLTLALGIVIASLIGILADRTFYGEWVFTPWNACVSFFRGGIGGSSPWWFYFDQILRHGIYPIGGLILLSGVVFFVVFRRDVLTWIVCPYLLAQILLPGKDLRFLYPVASAAPVMVFLSLQKIQTWIRPEHLRERIGRFLLWTLQPLWGANLILLVVLSFLPATSYSSIYRRISSEPNWQLPPSHVMRQAPIAHEERPRSQDEPAATAQAPTTGRRRLIA